jgi:hypothetical protein
MEANMKEILLRELLHLSRSLGEDMSTERQLELWVGGQSVHNSALDQCCPDFSCCHQELAWPEKKRREFAEAYIDEDRDKWLEMSAESIERLVRKEYPDVEFDLILIGEDEERMDGYYG